jgi:nucleoside phosphorylase
MSCGVFVRFAEAASVQGEDAVAAFVEFLRARGADDRFDSSLIADIAEIEPARAERLLERAASSEFGLVESEELLVCPVCDRPMRRIDAEAELASEEALECQNCGSSFEDLHAWRPRIDYRLSEQGLAESVPAPPTLTAVVVTALALESSAVIAHLENVREVRERGTIYTVGDFHGRHVNWQVAVVIGDAGAVNAAAAAERALAKFSPRLALFVGIAGGLEEQGMTWGKVVAATEVHNYEWGADYKEFRMRPMGWRSSYSLRQQAQQVQSAGKWPERAKVPPLDDMTLSATVEPIAAGDKLVRDKQSLTYQRVRSGLERAVAVEMEGHGFLAALESNESVAGIVIRGISDLCFDKREAGEAGTQPVAAANAAAFAFELLAQYQES